MIDTLESIRKRWTSRGFTDQKLTKDELTAITEAALASPSAINLQPWRFLVLQDKALIEEMDAFVLERLKNAENPAAYERISSRGGKVFYNAQAIIYIVREESPHSLLDCGIAAQNIALAAHGLGLGSVICGMAGIALPDYEKRLRFPEGFTFATSVLLGHPAQPGEPHPIDAAKVIYLD